MRIPGFLRTVIRSGDDIFGIYRDEGTEIKAMEDENARLCATRPITESESFKEGKHKSPDNL